VLSPSVRVTRSAANRETRRIDYLACLVFKFREPRR